MRRQEAQADNDGEWRLRNQNLERTASDDHQEHEHHWRPWFDAGHRNNSGHAATDAISDSVANFHTHPNADAESYSNTDSYIIAITDTGSNIHAESMRWAESDADSRSFADDNAKSDSITHTFTDIHTKPYAVAYTDSHSTASVRGRGILCRG